MRISYNKLWKMLIDKSMSKTELSCKMISSTAYLQSFCYR